MSSYQFDKLGFEALENAIKNHSHKVVESDVNHVAPEIVHDPSSCFIDPETGTLALYCSGTDGKMLIRVELDLENNKYVVDKNYFNPISKSSSEGFPQWIKTIQPYNLTGEVDAPCQLDNGQHIFYTVYDEEDGFILDAIGLLSRENQKWVDKGIVIQSRGETLDTPRCMDPSALRDKDANQTYLVFGSHGGGVWITELDNHTLRLKEFPNQTMTNVKKNRFVNIAQRLRPDGEESEIEAPTIFKRGQYFYLFANFGKCCRGSSSTYYVVIGRSKNPFGPYLDKDGNDMREGHGSVFLCDFGSRCIGPGHIGIMPLKEDKFLFTFHYYDKDDRGISKLGYNISTWKEGEWPMLTEQSKYISSNTPPSSPKNNLILIVVISVCLVIIVSILLYITLRKK